MEVTHLVSFSRKCNNSIIDGICRKICKFLGCYIGRRCSFGKGVLFVHNAVGTVIHSDTIVEDDVKIYSCVTLGQGKVYEPEGEISFHVKKGAILCSGARVLCSSGVRTIGRNSVVAANAVCLQDIPDYEVWGGVPAHRIGSVGTEGESENEGER